MAADGVVHVLEAGRIARFRQDGGALADITLPPALAGGRDLAVAPSGDLYVNNISRIVRVSPAGAELNGVGHGPDGRGPNAARVVVLMCHEDRDGVFRLLRTVGARPVDVASELGELVPRLQGRPRRA